ncbi:hypothetical protein M2E15_5019 [Bacillus mycoides]|nr:hypothetical protein M2E15_5019 [Bacillus mycoides]
MNRSSATGQLMFHLFASFAEFERNFIRLLWGHTVCPST